jgi:hypothetical protein
LRRVPDRLRAGQHIGSFLSNGRAYVYPALIELETWAVCLASLWAKNFFKAEGRYYPPTITRVTNLQEQKRWTQALAMLDSILHEPLPSDVDLVAMAQVNRWFCLQELGRDNDGLEREIQTTELREPELGADTRELAKLARYCLLRDYTDLIKQIRVATEGQHAVIDKQSLRSMPLMMRAMGESAQVRAVLLSGVQAQRMTTVRKRGRKRGGR